MDLRAYAKLFKRWKDEPWAFVRECLKAEPDAWQLEVLKALPREQRIAMKACKGPGKSCLMAWAIWWFLVTNKDSKVIATSITSENLKDGLWAELKLWQNNSPLLLELFTWAAERITCKERPETWFASARTWSKDADKTQQANTLAGVHADAVLFVLDEVSDYPDGVVAAAEGALSTGKNTKIIVAGNPTRTSGPLYRICTKDRKLWWVIEITGDPDDPLRAPRISVDWARQQIEQWGRDSAFVMVNVLGKFPPGQSDSVIGADLAAGATKVVLTERHFAGFPKILGVDPARYGDDRSVLFPRQGPAAMMPLIRRELSTMELVGEVVRYIEKWDPDVVFVDQNGLGGGVVDRLRELGYDFVIGIETGSKALRKGFWNRRAEMWIECRDWLRRGGSIPNLPDLVAELTAPTYKFKSDGRLIIESKDDLKARGMNSPDIADALVMTFSQPVQARVRGKVRPSAGSADYDPLAAFMQEVA